jgi:hypothetical protein
MAHPNVRVNPHRTAHLKWPTQLLADGAVPVHPLALKEAVTHHGLAKQKKDDCQEDYKQELSSSERGWLSSSRVRRIQWTGHT